MFRASLPVADASDTSLRAGVEDNLAHRLRATAVEGGRAHDAIHRGFQSDRVGRDLDPDYPVGIRLPALPEEAGGTLETPIVSIARSSKDARIAAALYFACLIMGVGRAVYLRLSLFFPGNAAALILQHEPTFRFAMLTE